MFCQNCGSSIPVDSQFCPTCGAKTGTIIQPQQPTIYQTPPQYTPPQQVIVTDSSSPGAFFLGLILPVVISIIFYLVWRKETPRKAQSILIGLLIRILPTVLTIYAIVCWLLSS